MKYGKHLKLQSTDKNLQKLFGSLLTETEIEKWMIEKERLIYLGKGIFGGKKKKLSQTMNKGMTESLSTTYI